MTNNLAIDKRDIFISHRSSDDDWAKGLAERLELSSVTVWIDDLDIQPVESVPGAINRGLQISRHVALVMTPDYFADNAAWTTAEWEAALFSDPDNRHQRVIPLYLKNCPYIPPLLSHLRWIDFRDQNNFKRAFDELLRLLQGTPARFPLRVAGQTITPSGNISRATLFSERASIDGMADPIEEDLASNILPATTVPEYVWSAPLAKSLGKQSGNRQVFPSKSKLKEIIHTWQEQQKVEHPFTPAFTRDQDRVWTLFNLTKPGHPLTGIVGESDIERKNISDLIAIINDRKLATELLAMCVSRYCYHIGLVEAGRERYLYPSLDGKDIIKKWKLQNPAKRTVTKLFTKEDGSTNFYYHDAIFVRIFFLGNRLFLRLKPTVAFSDNGTEKTIWAGPRVGPMAMNWMARQKNIDVFRDLRFWIYQLANGKSTIRIYAGDQGLKFDTRPAVVHVRAGIEDDQANIEELLQRLPKAFDERELDLDENFEIGEESDGDL